MNGFVLICTLAVLNLANGFSIPDIVRKKDFSELGANFDKTYTMEIVKYETFYDGRSSESTTEIVKRDKGLSRYQAWSDKFGTYAIEQKDEFGQLWQFHHMNDKTRKCEKYKKYYLDGAWREGGEMQNRLVNTYTDTTAHKLYLQYYYTDYDDEFQGRFKRWWTTVLDLRTGSYLPYKRDEYWNDWESRYTYVSLTNYTYTPTTMEWTPLPRFCMKT